MVCPADAMQLVAHLGVHLLELHPGRFRGLAADDDCEIVPHCSLTSALGLVSASFRAYVTT